MQICIKKKKIKVTNEIEPSHEKVMTFYMIEHMLNANSFKS